MHPLLLGDMVPFAFALILVVEIAMILSLLGKSRT